MAAEPRAPLVQRKAIVKVGDETTAGTLAGTLSLMAANCYDVVCEPGDFFSEGERQPSGNYMGRVASVLGKQMGTLKFKFDVAPLGPLCGAASLGGVLVTAAGYKSDGNNPPGFKPSSDLSTHVNKSFQVYQDGKLKVLTGCAAALKLALEDGKKLVCEVDVEGIWNAVTDAAMPAQAPIVAAPYVCRGITLTVAGAAIANVSKLDIDLGAGVEQRESITAASGIAHYLVGEILPKVTLDPEDRKVADQDVYGALLGGATAALVVGLVTPTGTLTIGAPAVQRVRISDSPRGKRQAKSLELDCCNSSGDDALSITETT